MSRRLAALAAVAVVVAFVYPMLASAPNLERAAIALALAGPAAGAAVAAAAGRPSLAAAALAGVGAYVSGGLALRGVPVPFAAVCGTATGAAAGGLIGALCGRLDGAGFLLATLLLTVCAGAAVQALPALTGAEAGLGPLPGLSAPLGGGRTAQLTPLGDFHLLLAVAMLGTGLAAVLLHRGPGPAWRAIGSDRARAAASGLRPLAGGVAALAFAGGLAAFSGALGAHVDRVATPQFFAPDVAALPLLAALAAARQPIGAALVAVATGVVGGVVLPAAGWQGPSDAMSLAIGVLAVAALLTLLPGGPVREERRHMAVDPSAPWPVAGLELSGAQLTVAAIRVSGKGGALLVDAPALTAAPGEIVAVVGPNGAGKSMLLGAIAARAAADPPSVATAASGGPARVLLLPQEGGGFASCTCAETLALAARRGRSRPAAEEAAAAWLRRLGLEGSATVLCDELSAGQRRLIDLARVLLARPNVLLCDEPLAGLDDDHRAAATACLREAAAAGLTVVVAEHDQDAVATLAGNVVRLERAGWTAVAPLPATP